MFTRFLAALTLLMPADGASAQTGCPVKVGGILPLTGPMAPITKKASCSLPTTGTM